MDLVKETGGAILPSFWTGSEQPNTLALSGRPPALPSLDFALPTVTKTGRVDSLIKNKTPIYIKMSDGTQIFLSPREFDEIKGEPRVGKMMTVIFQRHANDNTLEPSQIQSITCH